jgi:putative transposase
MAILGKDKIIAMNEQDLEKMLESIDFKNLTAEQITGENGLLKLLTKRIIQKAMTSEIDDHLGYTKHDPEGRNSGNSRNGKSKKTIITDQGDLQIEIPRDRNGEFEPQIIKKHQRRFEGFDDKIISMYGRGMTIRDIRDHLKDIYGVEVSPEFISKVTDAVIEDVKEWQNRPLDPFYAIVYFDALVTKSRQDGRVSNKAVYTAIGVNVEGKKDPLGLWISENEGAKFWAGIMTELKNRGVNDILIACIDGLKGLPDAIQTIFPNTRIQLCIVHMVRNSTRFVSYKERKALCTDLKKVYTAATEREAVQALDEFGVKWDKKYPMISKSWRSNWDNLNEFFSYPDEIRKAIYTTNAVESLNYSLRKVTKSRAAFPTDEAVLKLLYLALTNASRKWTMPIHDWGAALNQFALFFGGRVPL